MEHLHLPPNIIGRITTKGRLFFTGLLPVNTYADPGFRGPLQIVMHNFSNRYLKIFPGQPIAKIEFSRLTDEVTTPYEGRVYGEFHDLAYLKDDYVLSPKQVSGDPRIMNTIAELELAFGPDFGGLVRRVFLFEKRLIMATVAYLTFTAVLVAMAVTKQGEWLSPVVAVLVGVVSNAIFAALTWASTRTQSLR